MSIILKGIDLPSKPTQIKIYPNGIIFCASEDGMYVPKCQAIQIPKDHGRLIDESEINICGNDSYEQRMIDEEIADAPTILEAEENE